MQGHRHYKQIHQSYTIFSGLIKSNLDNSGTTAESIYHVSMSGVKWNPLTYPHYSHFNYCFTLHKWDAGLTSRCIYSFCDLNSKFHQTILHNHHSQTTTFYHNKPISPMHMSIFESFKFILITVLACKKYPSGDNSCHSPGNSSVHKYISSYWQRITDLSPEERRSNGLSGMSPIVILLLPL